MTPPTGVQKLPARLASTGRQEEFVRRPRLVLWSGVALILLVVLAGALIPARPLAIDQTWSEWMSDIQGSALHHVALVFNWLGRGLGRALTLVAIGIALALTRRWWALIAFAAAEALTPLATNLLKHLVDRPRPADAMLHATGSSFPSGHASYAGATAVALVLLFTSPASSLRVTGWPLAALATVAMAWSRTYLQVHWLSDAVAGALLGIGITLACFAAVQTIVSRSHGGTRSTSPGDGRERASPNPIPNPRDR